MKLKPKKQGVIAIVKINYYLSKKRKTNIT